MIPKIIHYCWFGGNPLPDFAKKCIDSWKKYCPDYVIKEWNENNFDITCCEYVQEASESKKWAFVSDYARFWVLYHEGGLYFDTDVELIKSIDDIVAGGAFMGCEPGTKQGGTKERHLLLAKKSTGPVASAAVNCNPGLGLGAPSGLDLYKEILEFYETIHYLRPDGTPSLITVVDNATRILIKNGWISDGNIRTVAGVTIYPPAYFCPLDYDTGEMKITEETRSIHHFTASWKSDVDKKYHQWTLALQNKFGYAMGKRLGRIIDFPHRVNNKISELGISGTVRFLIRKLRI